MEKDRIKKEELPEDTTLENIHQGDNIKIVRQILGVKQEILARELGITQQGYSKLENSKKLNDKIIETCAKVLEVPAKILKYLPEKTKSARQMIENLSISSDGQSKSFAFAENVNFCAEDILEMLNENKNYFRERSEKFEKENKKIILENERLKNENEILKKKLEENEGKNE